MLTSLSLRRSMPLLLGIFGLLFTVMLTAWHLPTRIEENLTDWRNHTSQHLALLQSSLSDHRRLGRRGFFHLDNHFRLSHRCRRIGHQASPGGLVIGIGKTSP